VELSRGDKILRSIGWLGGFYSRKAVRDTSLAVNVLCTSLVLINAWVWPEYEAV
jgi:hypothetical protein